MEAVIAGCFIESQQVSESSSFAVVLDALVDVDALECNGSPHMCSQSPSSAAALKHTFVSR